MVSIDYLKSSKSFLKLCWEALKDKVLVILCIAAIVSLALGCYESFGSGTHYDDEGLPLPKLIMLKVSPF